MRPLHQAADSFLWPFEDRFDLAVGKVAHPAGHTATLG